MSEIYSPSSIAGPPSTFMGAYNSGTSYSTGEAVSSGGSSYVALVNANIGNAPAASPTQWGLLAAAGADGADGAVGATGVAGSQGSVTALASSVLPTMGNLFDMSKVATGYALNADGTLSPNANWSTSGLIYCPGMTSMIAKIPITLSGAFFLTYDANGNVTGSLNASYFGAAYGVTSSGRMNPAAFPLPGTQVYVRFSYVPLWYGGLWTTSDATATVAASTGTATLPASYQIFGYDTPTDVNNKIAASAASRTPMLALLEQITQGGLRGGNRNAFDYLNGVATNKWVNSDGSLGACSGWNSTMVFAPNTTSFITNIPIWIQPGLVNVCTYDVLGNFLQDITPILNGLSLQDGRIRADTSYPLPGNQTYVQFSWNPTSFGGYSWAKSVASAVFYSGTVASPPPSSLTLLNSSMPFTGNAGVNIKTATYLGCALDQGEDCAAILNTFLATASATNPIKLILDGLFPVSSGLVIAPTGYTTIEGIGAGSGVVTYGSGATTGLSISGMTPYTGAPGPRPATNIVLRNFTITSSGVPAFSGITLAGCTNVLIEGMNFTGATGFCDFAVTLANSNRIFVRGCTFISTGAGHDGVHVNGLCEDIAISDCYFATGDDAIALNAPEGYGGDITRVTVTNCHFNGSMTVMRVYTSTTTYGGEHKVRGVVVSNCTGNVVNQCFNLGISMGPIATTTPDQLQDFRVSNCTFSAYTGLATLQTPMGSVVFSNITYTSLGAGTYGQLVQIMFTSIGNVVLDNVVLLRNADGNAFPTGFVYVYNGASVDRVSLLNCRVVDEEGSSYTAVPYLVDADGTNTVTSLTLEAIDMTHIATLVNPTHGWTGIASLRGGGVMGTGAQVPDAKMDNGALYLSSDASGAPSIKVGGTAKRLTLV